MAKTEKSFWDREREANNVRRKPLDNLDYITIPFSQLPCDLFSENEKFIECLTTLHILSEQKIVNLTGYSNTDLKLKYGAANITLLSEYDQNYTLFVRTLQKWADLLYEESLFRETQIILEFALSTNTDVGKTYYMLAKLYEKNGETEKIKDLVRISKSLNSANSKAIARTLEESYPYIC